VKLTGKKVIIKTKNGGI